MPGPGTLFSVGFEIGQNLQVVEIEDVRAVALICGQGCLRSIRGGA
jgi:hypothetical protein